MAQNITLMGASYSDVPAVTLPKTGGGTASFTDVTDTTAAASDVASGKYFYTAAGVKTEGTSSGGGTPAISVVDTTDTAGGTIRTITALDISDTTAVASDVASGKYFYTAAGVKTAGTGSGGGGGATQHTIHLEFSDSTDTDISVYYDDSVIGTMITAYAPSTWTYNNKTVYVAQLDNVTFYDVTPSPATWETIFDETDIDVSPNGDGTGYMYVTELRNVSIANGSEWRITIGGHADVGTAQYYSQINRYGIPHYNSSNVNDAISYNNGSAWIIYLLLQDSGKLDLKVERRTA